VEHLAILQIVSQSQSRVRKLAKSESRMPRMRHLPLGLLLLLVGCVDHTPSLDLSASKGRDGIALTNRSRELVTACTVRLLERGRDDEWTAIVPQLRVMDTVNMPWSAFSLRGAPLPPGIGPDAKHFTVSCVGPNNEPRSAGLAF
jgi:hypothetical protein